MPRQYPHTFLVNSSVNYTILNEIESDITGAWSAAATAQTAAETATTIVREGPLNLRDSRIGAALNGSDESAKLTTAFGLLPAAGGEIFLPPGTLGIGAEKTLPLNVSLTGAGQGASRIQPSSGYTGRLISTDGSNTVSKVRFSGLGTSGVLLTIRKARSMFSQLHFDNSGVHAIELAGTGSSTSAHANKFTDINIEDCAAGYGIYSNTWSYDNQFENVWIAECSVGLREQSGACFFKNLHVWGCVGNGVELTGSGHRNIFQNVYLETNGANGINLNTVDGTQIIGGRLWKNGANGAFLGTANRTRILGLDIHDNGTTGSTTDYGVQGANSLYCQVIGNQFYDSQGTKTQDRPILTSGTSDSWIITGNVMRTADHQTGGNTLVGAANVVANNIT